MTVAGQENRVKCTCPQKRDVYLSPAPLAPDFLVGKCGSCKKPHQYRVGQVPKPEPEPEPKPVIPTDGQTTIPNNEPGLNLSMDRDCVRLNWNGKTFTIGKIVGNEFQKFENGKGIHRATNSFGMPWALFKFLEEKKVKYIKIFYGGYWHSTTTENFKAKGFFLHFKGIAEKRIYLKREDF